jgi:transketolase
MKTAFYQAITELARDNPRMIFVKGDMAYIPDYQAAFPAQYLDVGVAEQNMIGVAAGLALEGWIPFTYSIVNFATMRCLEQIRNDIAYPNLNVKVVSCGTGVSYGPLGVTHHATEDLAIMRAIPNLTIFSPCDPHETMAVTKAAFAHVGPCFIRNGHGGEPTVHKEPIVDFTVGKAIQLKEGNDAAILATGPTVYEALGAAVELAEEGYEVSCYSFPTIKPLDEEVINEAANQARLIVAAEDHNILGGFGSAVAEVVAELPARKAAFKRIGINDQFTSAIGSMEYLSRLYQIDKQAIKDCIKNNLQ